MSDLTPSDGEYTLCPYSDMATERKHNKQVLVRLPQAVYDELVEHAQREHRSISAQVRVAIEQHLKAAA